MRERARSRAGPCQLVRGERLTPELGELARVHERRSAPRVRATTAGARELHEGSTTELTAAFRGCRSEAVDDRAPVHYSSSPRAVVSSAWTGTPACRPAPPGRGPAYVGLAV